MRTRKMRLMSFVLALAMMLAIAPVSAFAGEDDASDADVKYVEGLTFDSEGTPNTDGMTEQTIHGISGLNNAVGYLGTGWFWNSTNKTLVIVSGYTFDAEHCKITSPITCSVQNMGTIKTGEFSVGLQNNGTINGGVFYQVNNQSNAKINGGIFKGLNNNGTSVFNDGFVWGNAVFNNNNVYGGIFATEPVGKSFAYRTLSANECTINGYIQNAAYIVGTSSYEMTVTTSTKKFENWTKSGLDGVNITEEENTADKTISMKFTMPSSGNVEIKVARRPTELQVGENGLPEDDNEFYSGYLDTDGWTYNQARNYLTIGESYTANLQNKKVDWGIANNGTLIGGTFTGSVNNKGTIQDGVFENSVNNYGVVENGTFAGYFSNREDDDGNIGKVESGVFSQYANFGDAKPSSMTWLTVDNGTVNDVIPDMAIVVGKQTVMVAADDADGFTGWSVSGNTDFELTEEQKKSPVLSNLEIDGSDGGTIVLTAMRDTSKYRIKMLDGKANVTSALPGETVTLSIDDSEIPEGMSFDHWVVSPDVELEGDFKATDRTTSFKMPAQELTIYASLRTDSDDGVDAMTVVAGVAIGAGAAVLTYHIGTELYAKQVLGDGVAIPRTRADVALKAWELAGKPTVELNGEPLSEAAQAEKWAVESGLMQNVDGSFNGSKKMSKLKALRVLDAAKKLA